MAGIWHIAVWLKQMPHHMTLGRRAHAAMVVRVKRGAHAGASETDQRQTGGIRRFIEANRETFGLMLLSTSPAIAWRAAADADKRVEQQRQNDAILAQHVELGQKYLAWTVQQAGQVVA